MRQQRHRQTHQFAYKNRLTHKSMICKYSGCLNAPEITKSVSFPIHVCGISRDVHMIILSIF